MDYAVLKKIAEYSDVYEAAALGISSVEEMKAGKLPWRAWETLYAAMFPAETGNVAKPCRMVMGSLIIQQHMGFTDRDLVAQLQQNPYYQYFIGLEAFQHNAPFARTLLVTWRRRLTLEFIIKANDLLCDVAPKTFMFRKGTVLETKVFPELREKYLADPKSGPCPCFKAGDTFVLKRTPEQDDFYHLMNGKFCGEAWDAISRYVYSALQGGSIMRKWTNDVRMMIACCNDGTRPVIFKIERIDIPETPEVEEWLSKQNFHNGADQAYTG